MMISIVPGDMLILQYTIPAWGISPERRTPGPGSFRSCRRKK